MPDADDAGAILHLLRFLDTVRARSPSVRWRT